MNERQSDFALLREFVGERHQPAFATLVRRHLDLVYATALRKVGDSGGAEEIAQNVFCALARKAWQFAPDDSLPAWLHKTALIESQFWLRGEMRRRRREETAAELGTTMKTFEDQPAFNALVPLLDEALLSLRETDRTALLLRFYENHSLRDVGAAFGVSEDTAQKRVQSALEKLAEFFKRRGFKTATVAAAAAALQNTATTSSATLVSAVVSAALQAAPPALGLTALVARFASLSRVQTGALCVALAALPLGWQLKKRNGADEEAKRIQAQLLDARNQYAGVQGDLERLRADAQRLEQSLARANEAAMRAAESAKAFDVWKKRTRAQLMGDDYRWSDESPFARIPKSALPALAKSSSFTPFSRTGIGSDARELLGLGPAERQTIEETVHRHFLEVESRRANLIYETNRTSSSEMALPTTTFITPGLDNGKELAQQALDELHGQIGEQRWQMIAAWLERQSHYSGGTMEALLTADYAWLSKVDLSVEAGDKEPRLTVGFSGAFAGGQFFPLSIFLPDGDPDKTDGADRALTFMAEPLRQRVLVWAQEQALALGRKKDKP
jgi:RNA polymerase sigma factor (sigma-70 family)